MFGIMGTNISPNFFLVLPKILKKQPKVQLLIFSCAATSMTTSQILKFVDSAKTQKLKRVKKGFY